MTAALVAGAPATTTSTTTLASIGPLGGNGAFGAYFSAATPDGTRMLFATDESLVSDDTDSVRDLYERADGVTTLVSTGPNGGNSNSYGVETGFISADGARVFFETGEQLVTADDTDAQSDIYERSAGVTTLVSTGPNGDFGVDLSGMSEDGTRVFLRTEEPLVAADMDTQADIYERSGGTTTQVSTGPVGDDGNFQSNFSANSADGTRVFFDTQEPLVADDADTQSDTYERSGGTTTLVTTGPTGGNGSFGAGVEGISADGTRAFLQTEERLVASDIDARIDVYERTGGTTTLVSTGPVGGNGDLDATFQDTSADGTRVLFTTSERLVAGDTDSAVDVYERSGGVTSLVSAGGNGAFDVSYEDASEDATRVFFRTVEPLVAADTDAERDLYQRWRGATTLVSTGPAGGNGASQPVFHAVSLDGRRVFFTTPEPLVVGDTDSQPDVYERSGGETTLVSRGTEGGNGAFDAQFEGASADGTLMFFSSQEQLVAADTDAQPDVYQASLSAPLDPPDVIPEEPKPPIVVADTTAPQTKITKRPRNRTRKRLARFRFASTEAGSTFECKLDRKRYVPCRYPRNVRVKRGRHTFRVRAIDAAGNRDATPAVDRWKVLRK